MKTKIAILILSLAFLGVCRCPAQVRIKDVADVEGSSGRSVVGYGLVVGLNGTGDRQKSKFTEQSLPELRRSLAKALCQPSRRSARK